MNKYSTTVTNVIEEITGMNLQDRTIVALECAMEMHKMFIGKYKPLYIPTVYIHTQTDEHPINFRFEVISHSEFKELDIMDGVYVTTSWQTAQDIVERFYKFGLESGLTENSGRVSDSAVINACVWMLCQRHGDIGEIYSIIEYPQRKVIKYLEKQIIAYYNKYKGVVRLESSI